MKKLAIALAATLLTAAAAAAVAADAPPDPLAALQDGKETFEKVCSRCHSLEKALATKQDRAGWEKTVGVMSDRGAALEAPQRALVVDYLVAKSTFETKCSGCHGVESALAAKRNREEWTATVKRMAAKKPPVFTEEEIRAISAYLTLVVGAK